MIQQRGCSWFNSV